MEHQASSFHVTFYTSNVIIYSFPEQFIMEMHKNRKNTFANSPVLYNFARVTV